MPRLLIVDDEPFNRELLEAYLEGEGHELELATNGEQALALARARLPDLVLCDVMMPGVNGYDTARQLKELASGQFLPIMLVTALGDQDARVRGLSAGADEFLTKPVERHELLLRIRNLLVLRARTLELDQRNLELVELQRFRDEMSALIVHDLKSPLSVILMNVEYVLDEIADVRTEVRDALTDVRDAGGRILRMVTNLLDLVQAETNRLELRREPVDLASLLGALLTQRGPRARQRKITTAIVESVPVQVMADRDLLLRVFENILDNALRHTPEGGRIEASVLRGRDFLEVRIGNTGPAIPVERREQIFEKYGQAAPDNGRMNLGLGLYFCRIAAEAHRGSLTLEGSEALPVTFVLKLPLRDLTDPPDRG